MHLLFQSINKGGWRRFYRGYAPAIIQGPASRFGDTAANAGIFAFLESFEQTRHLPVAVKTACASLSAGMFRIALMPIDACKTILQVEGKHGLKILAAKVHQGGPSVIFHGSLAAWYGF